MTIAAAAALVPDRVPMQKVLHSDSGNKQQWGYDEGARTAYIIFAKPGTQVALYSYSNVPFAVAKAVRSSSDDSQTLDDLLVKDPGSYPYARLYPLA
ncbi:MAG: hypothetical protein QG597_1186 [Actinomycetota bacterium]|nr:hypothetical protein [Actinomycetota bacterium]